VQELQIAVAGSGVVAYDGPSRRIKVQRAIVSSIRIAVWARDECTTGAGRITTVNDGQAVVTTKAKGWMICGIEHH
jgi:hypothetical protein